MGEEKVQRTTPAAVEKLLRWEWVKTILTLSCVMRAREVQALPTLLLLPNFSLFGM